MLPPLRTWTPFLYPISCPERVAAKTIARRFLFRATLGIRLQSSVAKEHQPTEPASARNSHPHSPQSPPSPPSPLPELPESFDPNPHPSPSDYSTTPFTDTCILTVRTGSGGRGCVSFLREKYIPEGPPNGGDGGTGGNVFIQAVRNCTSLHVVARRPVLSAGHGGHGMGGNRTGKIGDDVLVQVPVGTVVREIARDDPVEVEEEDARFEKVTRRDRKFDKWIRYPGKDGTNMSSTANPKSDDLADGEPPTGLPPPPKPRRSPLAAMAPPFPIQLDLSTHMSQPRLLAAGAMGGLGNSHFVTRQVMRPTFATKGDGGMTLRLLLHLKLVADVGLVGLPNAGKSSLLRAITNSRARVGGWAFTTLKPNLGVVVLDENLGRPRGGHGAPLRRTRMDDGSVVEEPRTHVTVADIPGLISDAHLNRGLGLDFLRHIERARLLAFVIDLSAGPSVEALKALWREIVAYDAQRLEEVKSQTRAWKDFALNPFSKLQRQNAFGREDWDKTVPLPPVELPPVSTTKPWFVVANKADLEGTEDEWVKLRGYVARVASGVDEHPSGRTDGWRRGACVVPVSAAKGKGVDTVVDVMVDVLGEADAVV